MNPIHSIAIEATGTAQAAAVGYRSLRGSWIVGGKPCLQTVRFMNGGMLDTETIPR
jgi:hypothetical protein